MSTQRLFFTKTHKEKGEHSVKLVRTRAEEVVSVTNESLEKGNKCGFCFSIIALLKQKKKIMIRFAPCSVISGNMKYALVLKEENTFLVVDTSYQNCTSKLF
jgi:hypothetical protein